MVGRKKIYASAAERMAAYRARKASKQQAEIDTLRAQVAAVPAAPAVDVAALLTEIAILKRTNSTLELDLRDATRTKPGKLPKQAAVKHRQAALNAAFVGTYFTSPDDAKRFRTNTTRAATAAAEAVSLLERTEYDLRQHLAGDIELLKIAAGMLNSYASSFEAAQKEAEHTKARREREMMQKRKQRNAEVAQNLFGNPIDADSVQSMAADLLEFFASGNAWVLEKRRKWGVVSVLVSFGNSNVSDYEIKNAARTGDIKKLALAIAEIIDATAKQGSEFRYHDDLCWSAGLDDFEAWRIERGHGKA